MNKDKSKESRELSPQEQWLDLSAAQKAQAIRANLTEDMQTYLLRPNFALNQQATNLMPEDVRDDILTLRTSIFAALDVTAVSAEDMQHSDMCRDYRRLIKQAPSAAHAKELTEHMHRVVDAYIRHAAHFITIQSRTKLSKDFMAPGSKERAQSDVLGQRLVEEMERTYQCMETLQSESARENTGLLNRELISDTRLVLAQTVEFLQRRMMSFRSNLRMRGTYVAPVKEGEKPTTDITVKTAALAQPVPGAARFRLGTEPKGRF